MLNGHRSPPLSACFQNDARYAFIVDWYDATACMMRQYQLMYHASDGTIEMVRSLPPARRHGRTHTASARRPLSST